MAMSVAWPACLLADWGCIALRCRSRLGIGDMGVNAGRIRKFLQELQDELMDEE